MAARILEVGPTVVYTPGPAHQHLVDIIFVHGLFGHRKNTWTARTPRDSQRQSSIADRSTDPPQRKLKIGSQEPFDEIFWPRDLLPTEIPTVRIITWGYDVRIESLLTETSKATVFQHAETLLGDLVMLRPSRDPPIIFVAHSLGGIVVKVALSLSQQETTHLKDILPAAIGVAFLGTPHQGSKTAPLEGQSEILDRISKSFAQILASKEDIKVHSFQEELETKGMSIVDASSSTIGSGRGTRSGLYANHRNMTRYASAEDINFQRVSSVLRRWVEPLSARRTSSDQLLAPYGNLDEDPTIVSDKEFNRLLARLNFPAARSRVEDVEAAYTDNHAWVYDDGLGFKEWLQGQNPRPIFWISGKPGSGKSTLMKHALRTSTTGNYLKEYNQTSWILTSYFFHDHGSEVQKTMEGFLCEILYQILVQRRDLFLLIHPILRDWSVQKELQGSDFRSIEKLRRAIFAIARNSKAPLNCCIFIDALDEHLGNHRELMTFLKDLAGQDWTPNFCLRLCVASRPENIFVDALHDYPGFAIHEHTRADIRSYVAGRFQKEEQSVILDEQQKQITSRLVSQIEAKSDGVFMWVRLVVNELVEGLCEGDTLGELEALLSKIPNELSDLYVRAISRHPRRSTTSIAKHRNEAYIMFRLATLECMTLRHLIRATLFLNGVEHAGAEVDGMSQNSMQRRLNSRSSGLLEVIELNSGETDSEGKTDSEGETDSDEETYSDEEIDSDEEIESIEGIDSDEGSENLYVQFIHQTAKEFILSTNGAYIIKEGITLADEDGSILIFRYISERLKICCEWAIRLFADYANHVEWLGKPVESLTEQSKKKIPKSALISIINRNTRENRWESSIFYERCHNVLWAIIYCSTYLKHSLQRLVKIYPDVLDQVSDMLFKVVRKWTRDTLGCYQTLLKAGVACHLTAISINEMHELVKERLVSKNHVVSKSEKEQLERLWISKTAQFRTESGETDIQEGTVVGDTSDYEY